MTQLQPSINPFMLLTDPQAVLTALARFPSRLESRICRPLDDPLAGSARDEETEHDETDDDTDLLDW
jgi:hypothetical protein